MPLSTATPPAVSKSHVVGRFGGDLPGPTMLVVGAIHGNEPAGLKAIERVLAWLRAENPRFRGRLIGLVGNLSALARGERFITEDLNRIWSENRIAGLRDSKAAPTSADAEQQAELLAELDAVLEPPGDPVTFLDLHTSSARGEPFVCIGDTLANRRFAMRFPVPVILGLEEQIDGALLEYVNNLGHVTVGVEAGQHDHPESVDRHEAFILLALIAAGCIDEAEMPQAAAMRELLAGAVGELPQVLEVRYRHAITAADQFAMRAGFGNFEPIDEGALLASDRTGEIRAREHGRILLPLYQGLGNDGFFIVRQIRPFWLRVSELLRRARLDRLVGVLPGVRRSPDQPREILVNPRVARWFTVEVFHLLGYRKERPADGVLRFSRRVESD